MPYIFVDELPEGVDAANVVDENDYLQLMQEKDTLDSTMNTLQTEYDELSDKFNGKQAELNEAKQKFANAFLSSPNKMKQTNNDDIKSEEKPMTFSTLFKGRDKNAN